METRMNKVIVMPGRRGAGKTYYLKKKLLPKLQTKMLVIDTLDHPAYRDLQTIQPEQIPLWVKGNKRIIASNFEKTFEYISKHLWNATIVFEDCFKYLGDKAPDRVIEFILDSKQKNLDLLFMYQCWRFVQPNLLRVADFATVFKTSDSPKLKEPYIGEYDDVMATWQRVKNNPDPHHCETVALV